MTPRNILLIGSSGGLGTGLSRHLSKQGHQLALHYFKHKPVLDPTTKNMRTYTADITKEDQIAAMIKQIQGDFGSIDVVINNAGVSKSAMSWKMSLDDWNETLAVNLTGPFLVSKYVLPKMREKKSGRIINISSVVAQTGFAGTAAYAASKAGLQGLVRSIAKEVAGTGITVNSIALGYFDQGMIHQVPENLVTDLVHQIPVGKLGSIDELGGLVDYLISDSSSYLTGQTIQLNGGLYF